MFTKLPSRLLACLAALALPVAAVAQVAPIDKSKLYCFSGGLYDGLSNLGRSSISYSTVVRENACSAWLLITDLSCSGVGLGSPNESYRFGGYISRCMWI